MVIADRRLMPPRIEELKPGVAITPSLITNRFSPVPSQTKPRWSSRMPSSKPARSASILASTELRYWPLALASGISASCPILRQETTVPVTPRCLPSSPR